MTMPDKTTRILVVDDEPDLRTLYELTLLREGYLVDTAPDLEQARTLLAAQRYEVVITDMRLPDGSGMSLITDIKAEHRPERSVVITAYGSAQNAVEALKSGAFDYLTKPVDLKQFRHVIATAANGSPAAPEVAGFGKAVAPTSTSALGQRALAKLVGHSECMQNTKERILKVAASMAPVMITGESGTGKELVAYAIHANSHRAKGPWVAVNCGAIPENLLEAEFFGVKKGAFTGAQQDREGFFQAARGGTLFLDEIGDLPLAMQSKLLRAIQERRIRPLGSTAEDTVDVRIVSATHKNLALEVQESRFRQDLFYRLNVIDLVIAPLRERKEDLPELCAALLAHIAEESAIPVPDLAPSAIAQLAQLPLPGNVRELENLLYRAVALGDGKHLHLESGALLPFHAATNSMLPVPTELTRETPIPNDLQEHLDTLERAILLQVLQETHFNRTAAAARLGISLRQMRYRITRLQIDLPVSVEIGDDGDTQS
jgi:two-component system response regulator PilR (NtrC family)